MWRAPILFIILFVSCYSNKELTNTSKSEFEPAATFQLVAPQIQTDSVLFRNSTLINLELDFPETAIYYTLDGSEVTRSSNKYNGPLTIGKSSVLLAKAFHSECQASEIQKRSFFKVSDVFEGATFIIDPLPDSRYSGEGVQSLTDLRKGGLQFRGDNRWLGFKIDTVEIRINFLGKKRIQSLTISTLANEIGWIFLPGKVELISNEKQFADWDKATLENASETGLHFLKLEFPERELEGLTVRILSDPLPEGHNGYGGVAWFFVDEIFVE